MLRPKVPLATFSDLPTAAQAGACFSPDEALIATGTARVPGSPLGGALVRSSRLKRNLESVQPAALCLALLGRSSRLLGLFFGSCPSGGAHLI